MDQLLQTLQPVIAIFNQIGIDISFFHQLVLFFVLFFLLKAILFNKLQSVLETREGKTTKLDGEANRIFKEAEELNEKYEREIQEVHEEAQSLIGKEKAEIHSENQRTIKANEEQIGKDYEQKREAYLVEMGNQKNMIMAKADELSGNLVDKLIQ